MCRRFCSEREAWKSWLWLRKCWAQRKTHKDLFKKKDCSGKMHVGRVCGDTENSSAGAAPIIPWAQEGPRFEGAGTSCAKKAVIRTSQFERRGQAMAPRHVRPRKGSQGRRTG